MMPGSSASAPRSSAEDRRRQRHDVADGRERQLLDRSVYGDAKTWCRPRGSTFATSWSRPSTLRLVSASPLKISRRYSACVSSAFTPAAQERRRSHRDGLPGHRACSDPRSTPAQLALTNVDRAIQTDYPGGDAIMILDIAELYRLTPRPRRRERRAAQVRRSPAQPGS